MTRRLARLIAALAIVAAAAPWLAPYDPALAHEDFLYAPPMPPHVMDAGGLRAPFAYPITLADRLSRRYDEDRAQTRPLPWFGESSEPVFLLGADSYGRDLLSRLLHGARVSLTLALVSVAGALVLGALIGGLAGYRRGLVDDVLMWTADFILVLPVIYVVLVLRAVLPLMVAPETVFLIMTGVFALSGWPFVARGVRSIVAVEREKEYVVAARSVGASPWRILGRHLLPACTEHLIVQGTLLLPAFILAEATLSYVGLGFPESVATWGTMLREATNLAVMTSSPWMLAPAAAIYTVVLSVNAVTHSDQIPNRPI
jgi:peptide/nickel transport system permease protein